MNRFARTVFGDHGCDAEFARQVLAGEVSISAWNASQNPWDWLGHGIYFWEYAPERARSWGDQRGGNRAVIGAIIQLGNCLDLSDVAGTERLADQYEVVRESFDADGRTLPENRGGRGDLDCLVINSLIEATGATFETVRCPFLEGNPAFPGSRIRRDSHVQLVVRNPSAIVAVFRPT